VVGKPEQNASAILIGVGDAERFEGRVESGGVGG
jgi:hypothetical protein